jgi:hypothetical protein
MKEQLNKLIKEFLKECDEIQEKYGGWEIEPTFEQVINAIKAVRDFAESVLSAEWPENKFRGDICNLISWMLDNPDKTGIYPTSKCFDEFEILIGKIITSCRLAHAKAMLKHSQTVTAIRDLKDEEIQEYIEACIKAGLAAKDAEIARWKVLEKLTPQGSEFVNCPENIFLYLKERMDTLHLMLKENVRLRREIAELR